MCHQRCPAPPPPALAADILALFQATPDLVQQQAALLRAEGEVPEEIQTLALRALAVQLLDRSRHAAVLAGIAGGEQSGLLALLLHRSVASLTGGSRYRGVAGAGAAAGAGCRGRGTGKDSTSELCRSCYAGSVQDACELCAFAALHASAAALHACSRCSRRLGMRRAVHAVDLKICGVWTRLG